MCEKSFTKRTNLKLHTDSVHKGKPRPRPKYPTVKCNTCTKELKDAYKLRRHIRLVHDKIKDFSCEMCEKKFSQKCNLERHNRKFHKNIFQK